MTEANNTIINEALQTKELIQFQTSNIIEIDNCLRTIFDSQTKQEDMENQIPKIIIMNAYLQRQTAEMDGMPNMFFQYLAIK
jgi:hypothetical protein